MKRRLFIAVELSDEMKEGLQDALDQLRENGIRGRYERVNNLHITLAFIGETERLDDIKKAVDNVEIQPMKIALTSVGSFGRNGILWMGMSNEKKLANLASKVRAELDKIGVTYSTTPFKGHITLVRDASTTEVDVDVLESEMTVSRISVMETTFPGGRKTYVRR